ncbi:MAG: tyrosine--tRNA ligase [Hydrogenophilus sp.]|nr:tyrosine--tRNA ligase [Hydrogenophilus sp.]
MTVALLTDLFDRGLIARITHPQPLADHLARAPITLYCGFDPTADSLHLGHLVPILTLLRFQKAGHRPIALVGGATGLIGDPSFKANERKLNPTDIVAAWSEKIRQQLEPFLDFTGPAAAQIVNNHDWFREIDLLTFLRDIGKHFSVNAMIKKEAIAARLERDDIGISYTEFSYMLLQAYDFLQLYRRHGCLLQIGGSDQWGNITAGIGLIRRLHRVDAYGLTLPLITKADGTKFGKTESGTLWLDPCKTSPYQFYQFWINTTDADVYRFLAYFTFLTPAQIAEIEDADRHRSKPEAQRILAREVTRLVHGADALTAAERITQALFGGDLNTLTEEDYAQLALDGLPRADLPLLPTPLVDALVAAGLARSKSDARTQIDAGAIAVNGQRQTDSRHLLDQADRRHHRYTLLTRGKKHHALILWHPSR